MIKNKKYFHKERGKIEFLKKMLNNKYGALEIALNSRLDKSIQKKTKIHVIWYAAACILIFSLFFFISIIGCSKSDEKSANSTAYDRGGEVMPDNLVLCREDFTVKYKDGTISLSRDGGKTYNKSIFVDDKDLQGIHVFENGTLFFVDHTKCYYSHDWETLHESTVLDINGDPFVPYKYHNFSINMGGDTHRHIIDGQEILCWGNYDYQYDTQYKNVNVWYTVDKGETVKTAYKFRSTEADDGSGNLYTRHVHNVNFNPSDNTFWLQTGDFISNGVDQRHVLKGTYDLHEDEWNWSLVGTGHEFKWCNALFIGDYIYFSWDVSNGGVVRVPYDKANDISKHDLILATPNDCLAVIKSHKDEIIAVQAPYGGDDDSRNLYYSPDRKTWYRIENTIPEGYSMIAFLADMSTDNWGRVRATPQNMSPHKVLPAIFLDEIVREAGFPDAFKPINSVP